MLWQWVTVHACMAGAAGPLGRAHKVAVVDREGRDVEVARDHHAAASCPAAPDPVLQDLVEAQLVREALALLAGDCRAVHL